MRYMCATAREGSGRYLKVEAARHLERERRVDRVVVRRDDLVVAPVDGGGGRDDSGGRLLDLVVDDELEHEPQASDGGSWQYERQSV